MFVLVSYVHPELRALIGARTPDLRGLFLRGYGSQSHTKNNGSTVGVTTTTHQSGALGAVQGDVARNITGRLVTFRSYSNQFGTMDNPSGVFSISDATNNALQVAVATNPFTVHANMDVSRQVPTGNENRPVNTAVRYLIKALK